MPQQNERLSFATDECVSDIDYSEARTILDLTALKQKQLRRQRSQLLHTQLLLKRTHVHICQLLDSECSIKKPKPLSIVDTNKRKLPSDDHGSPSKAKKVKELVDNDILQFLHELNSVKVTNSEYITLSSACSAMEQTVAIIFAL